MGKDKRNKPRRITNKIKKNILTMAVTHDSVAENLVQALRYTGEGNYEGLIYDEQKKENVRLRLDGL